MSVMELIERPRWPLAALALLGLVLLGLWRFRKPELLLWCLGTPAGAVLGSQWVLPLVCP